LATRATASIVQNRCPGLPMSEQHIINIISQIYSLKNDTGKYITNLLGLY